MRWSSVILGNEHSEKLVLDLAEEVNSHRGSRAVNRRRIQHQRYYFTHIGMFYTCTRIGLNDCIHYVGEL